MNKLSVVSVVDESTGEVKDYRRVYSGKQFWKLHMKDFLKVLRAFESKQLNVLIYILENTKSSTNTFTGTFRSISKACKVSLSTVTQVMDLLQKSGFIVKLQNGNYIVSPNVLMKGDERKRGMLLQSYNAAQWKNRGPKGEVTGSSDSLPEESVESPEGDEA